MGTMYCIFEECAGCKDQIKDRFDIYGSSNSFFKVPSGGEIPRSEFESLSWCNTCEKFTLCFNPISTDKIKEVRIDLQKQYNQKINSVFYNFIGRYLWRHKMIISSLHGSIIHCDNLIEFASNRIGYNNKRCYSCGSKDVDLIKVGDSLSAKIETGRAHYCGSQIINHITIGHYQSRLLPGQKRKLFDCNDKEIL